MKFVYKYLKEELHGLHSLRSICNWNLFHGLEDSSEKQRQKSEAKRRN